MWKVAIDLTGRKFGRLTVVERDCNDHTNKYAWWVCRCECGNYIVASSSSLNGGHTQSCGCLFRETVIANNMKKRKHGMINSRIYNIWRSMKKRCLNPNHEAYPRYGGRGITVCDEWKDDFQTFYDWAMTNGYQEGLTIDRIDVNGNYEPGNCRWATAKEQNNNTRNNRLLTHNGETHTMAEWADITGIGYDTLQSRLFKGGWTVEEALTKPVRRKEKKYGKE